MMERCLLCGCLVEGESVWACADDLAWWRTRSTSEKHAIAQWVWRNR